MRLQGLLQGQEIQILIGSGISSTFIRQSLVEHLGLSTTTIPSATVIVEDGGQMTCENKVPELQWWTQGHTFISEAKVLLVKLRHHHRSRLVSTT